MADAGLALPVADSTCGRTPRAVALLIGQYIASHRKRALLESTARALETNALEPSRADLVAVFEAASCASARRTDLPDCTLEALESEFELVLRRVHGHRLRALGVVEAERHAASPPPLVPMQTWDAGAAGWTWPNGSASGPAARPLLRARLPPPSRASSRSIRAFDKHGHGALGQWYKLQAAWALMEAVEAAEGGAREPYGLVLKLRIDLAPSTPLVPCAARDGLLPGGASPRLVHAATDWMFWGRRDAMAVACQVWAGLRYFESEGGEPLAGGLGGRALVPRVDAHRRPVATRALLASLLALPAAAFAPNWLPYAKIESMLVPRMHAPPADGAPAIGARRGDAPTAPLGEGAAQLEPGAGTASALAVVGSPTAPARGASGGAESGSSSAESGSSTSDPQGVAAAPGGMAATSGVDATFFYPANRVPNLREVRAAMVAELRAAIAAGWEWIDPADAAAAARGQPSLRFMIHPRAGRPPRGLFVTEQDFIHWLTLHNVTACDLGGGVRGYVGKKGLVAQRDTVDDCIHPPRRLGPLRADSTAPAASARRAALAPDAGAAQPQPSRAAPAPTGAERAGALPTRSAAGGGCVPPPAARVESGVARSGGGGARRVAIAFHGQFLKRTDLPLPVSAVLPASWAAPPAAPRAVAYDAFVATSTQRSELSACEPLDGADLCGRLVAEARFAYALCDHVPYDARTYVRWASELRLPVRDSTKFSLYPHRVLSSFSTMARALRLVREHAEAQDAAAAAAAAGLSTTSRPAANGSTYYDLIALARVDVFFHNVKLRPWPPGRSWLADVAKAGLVARRKAHKPQWEDRFIIGVPAQVRVLEALADRPAFAARFRQLGNQAYPEAQILLVVSRSGLVRTSQYSGPFFTQFADIEGFRQNKNKFRAHFINVSAIAEAGAIAPLVKSSSSHRPE